MLDTVASGASTVRLQGFRRLSESSVQRPAQGLAAALSGARGAAERSVEDAPPARGGQVALSDDKLRLRREDLGQTLLAMKREAYRQAEPERSRWPRWVQALNILPRSHAVAPRTVAIVESLRQTLAAGDAQTPLDIKECARLSLDMEALARAATPGSPLAELSQRLALLGQAAWAQLARTEAEAQLLPQFQRFDQPGASQERNVGGSVGVGLGLGEAGAGAKATFSVGLAWSRGMDNDDEGFVFQNQGKAVSARAGVQGGVGVATLSGAVEGRRQRTMATEYASATAFVKLKADQLTHGSRRDTLGVSARTVVGALIRLFRPSHGNELRQYQQLQQQAADQQQRLGVLLGWLGQRDNAASLPGAQAPYLPPSKVDSVKGSASARAEAVGVGAGVAAAVERIDIQADALTPIWQGLRQEQGAARNATIAQQRLAGIEQKAAALMGADARNHPLSWLSGAQNMAELREQTPAKLRDAAEGLRAEFEHFCAVAQQLDAGIGKRQGGAAVERSVQASWRAGSREETLANMALAHAALTLTAAGKGDAELLQSLDALAPRLYAPPIRHDAAALAKRTSFHDVLRLQIRDRSVALDLGGALGPLGLKAEASLTERTRVHHNPVRAGDYKDVRISLSGNLSGSWPLDALRDALSAQLAPHGLAAEVPAALAGLQSSAGLQGGGALTLLLRFYRPQYQTQADFPAEAAGFRLQLSRVSASGNLGVSASGGVPLQPGVSLELGLNAGASATAVLGERWGDNSLSAPLMHYLHLKGVNESERWPALRVAQRPALEALCRKLAEPGSAVRQEADYYLRRQGADGVDFFAAMERFAASGSKPAGDAALDALDAMMERQLPLWQADKQSFAGWEELPLAR
ncbi:hypothetical protein [Chromobacterium sp. LK11]|uniref:hypothetical protein n=1 Tax=Chromobacterium sp. LK11 TaxID=1628212 RepID=UPI000A812F17|nr:hypothetical protein [Chromobacterium sp. LK11]